MENNIEKLVPQLRFGEFLGEYSPTTFGELYSFTSTNSLSRDKLNYEKGEVFNIHYGDIHTKFKSLFFLKKETVPFINEDINLSKIKEEQYCKVGDIVIADASEDYNDIGKSIELIDIANAKILAGLHTFRARPYTKKTAVGYFNYLLKSWNLRKQIMMIAQGTKVLGLSTKRFSKLKLNIPTKPEQKKIATFLSAIDKKIQQLSRKKALLEEYKKGLMQQLFSGELRFKNENGEDFGDWELKKLGEVGRTFNGLTGKTKEDFGRGEPYIQYKQIFKNSKINVSDFGLVDVGEDSKQKTAKYGDVFFTTSSETPNEIGTSSVLLDKVENLYLNSFCFGFRPKSLTVLTPDFSRYFFRSQNIRRKIVKLAQGSTRYNMSKVEFMKMSFLIPSAKEQQKIANYLSSFDKKIETLNTQITKAKTFKKGLLQQLFV